MVVETNKHVEWVQLFVYGTLKKGGKLHNYLQGYEFVGNGALPGYDMYIPPNVWYPAVSIGSKARGFVYGEIYRVPKTALRKLDEIEGVPELFVRLSKTIVMGDVQLSCQVYVYNKPLTGATLVLTGEWDVKTR